MYIKTITSLVSFFTLFSNVSNAMVSYILNYKSSILNAVLYLCVWILQKKKKKNHTNTCISKKQSVKTFVLFDGKNIKLK